MHNILLFIWLFQPAFSSEASPRALWEKLKITSGTQEKILKGKMIAYADMETFGENNEKQKLHYYVTGLHNKACSPVLRKLSRYEEYSKYLDFVKKSQYNDKTKLVYLGVSHFLFPIKFTLKFNIPRITKPGEYNFHFSTGFLKNLKGKIKVYELIVNKQKRCFFHTHAEWQGKHSGFPAAIIEIFAETASRAAMERLFRVSR